MEMTISGLREKLVNTDEEQLRELICQLYKHSEVSQQMIDSRFLGDDYGVRIAQEMKQKLDQAFFPHEKIDLSLANAKELLRLFRKRCQNQRALIDVELYYVECGLDFMNMFGAGDGENKNLLLVNYASAVARILEDESHIYFHMYFSRCGQIIQATKEFTPEFVRNMTAVYQQLAKE
ncbi:MULTISPECIES: hypothetical protein [Enterococcus]|jgi:hypothetical protein|uniref:hypothetical protein n=1 Tax=Enterococcus TaxID=1350 RepID=UPI000A33DA83|nr:MULTISPECIES: hypothetical protein [Enterococcus]AXG39632.1 hypothetical protein EGCR1_13395 [Enterococcus gilvus]MDU5512244.1 hypothetical protein [Enterococcus gilvus]OTO71331.1 hypothetical protein A5865_003027 [Enterococcus sp. 12E11_DIV0728]OUZ15285.1 hypothetical protein A5868_000193 [Enterococcus sp. 12F9_DIV0723]